MIFEKLFTFFMKEIECAGNFFDDLTCLSLTKVIFLLNSSQQLTTVYLFKDEIKFVIIFEKFNELNNIRMSLTVVECLHFLKHPGSSMAWNFVNNFHSIFQISIQ